MKTWRDRLMERPLDRLKQDIRMQRAQLEIVKKDLATAVLLAMEAMRGIRDEPFGCDVCTDSSAESCRFCSYTLAWEALEDALATLKAEYGGGDDDDATVD